METKILKLLGRAGYVPSNVPQLIEQLGLEPGQQQELQEVLRSIETAGKILRTKGNRYILAQAADLVPGTIQINRQGKGFLQPEEPGAREIVIPESATSTALNGDRVLVRRDIRPTGLRQNQAEEEPTGTVVRILERKRTRLVGTLRRAKEILYVVPDDPRIPHHITVPPARDTGRPAVVGDKVVVELTLWEDRFTPPEGEIVEVLGPPDAEGVDMLSVLRNYGLPLSFPKEVLDEAQAIAKSRAHNEPSPEEFVDRVDCREHNVITIDPDDAKDFDDAICLENVGRNAWKLWVHIADVSYYVKPGTELDKEAAQRGNSTYLVDRVIPMLPEALSNELCSLKPGVARMTKCVEFDLSDDGTVMGAKFYSAVIRSQRRFTYQEAYDILQHPPQDELERLVHDANDMAQKIRRARFQSGALNMDFPESKIRLDEHGRVTRIERMENDESHQLIEEYMLLANEAVASRLNQLSRPSIHRVHEQPKAKRLQAFQEDVLGHNVPCGDLTRRGEVQKLLAMLERIPIGAALKIGFLRSMMRARYAVESLGHYGLHKMEYAHFTSPIRRYADLIVHRTLFDKALIPVPLLKKTADHISNTERISADAERDSKEVKLYAYLKAQLKTGKLERYDAIVTDIRNFGFFVDVSALGLSGLIHLSAIKDDFFIFDPARSQLFGKHSRRTIRLGDHIDVQIHRVVDEKKQVDFELAPEAAREARKSGDRGRKPAREPAGGREPRPQRDLPQQGAAAAGGDKSGRRKRQPLPFQEGPRSRADFGKRKREGSPPPPEKFTGQGGKKPRPPEVTHFEPRHGRDRGGEQVSQRQGSEPPRSFPPPKPQRFVPPSQLPPPTKPQLQPRPQPSAPREEHADYVPIPRDALPMASGRKRGGKGRKHIRGQGQGGQGPGSGQGGKPPSFSKKPFQGKKREGGSGGGGGGGNPPALSGNQQGKAKGAPFKKKKPVRTERKESPKKHEGSA